MITWSAGSVEVSRDNALAETITGLLKEDVILDLSWVCSAPMKAMIAAKEMEHEPETNGRTVANGR